MSDVTVRDDREASRFEARLDDQLAGWAEYDRREGTIVFTHTEVGEEYGGKGVGSALARGSLDAARAEGLSVLPECEFIAGWIDKHPDYQDLVRTA